MHSLIRLLRHEERGVAALEFALVVPFLVLVLIGVIDLSFLIHNRMQLSQTLTAAAQYAFHQGQSESGNTLSVDVKNFVTNTSPMTISSLSVSYNGGNSADSCYCVNGAAAVYTGPLLCGAACTDGSGATAGKFLSIAATISPTPFFALDRYFFPSLLGSSVTVRLK